MTPHADTQYRIPPTTRIAIAWSLALSTGWVLLCWGFWDRGPYALGLNAFLYLGGLAALFLWSARGKGLNLRKELHWIIPMGLIIAGFGLYDNPFLKMVSLLILPPLFAGFLVHAFIAENSKHLWTARLVFTIISRVLGMFAGLWNAAALHVRVLERAERKEHAVIRRIVLGTVLFLMIAATVVIPLLASADATFGAHVDTILDLVRTFVSTTLVMKILVALFLSVVTIAGVVEWCKPSSYTERDDAHAPVDSIVAGIVLGGTLALYLLFLGIQVQHLWVGSLPFDFATTEHVVKSGFWQLLFLTAFNIVITFLTYRRTTAPVQRILLAFSAASLLLLVSAGHRMALYVTTYGLSYEKLFASYAVLYCAILFVWLLAHMTKHVRADVLRFAFLLFLWMFGILAVLPTEQLIFRTNIALAQREGSRISLYEMTMLSPDVLMTAKRYAEQGRLAETKPFSWYIHDDATGGVTPTNNISGTTHPLWEDWFTQQEDLIAKKTWYEKTLTNLIR